MTQMIASLPITNIEPLQRALDTITIDIETWNQGSWCALTGGAIDPITEADIEVGTYHDFEFTDEVRTALIERILDDGERYGLAPIGTCGTALCLAGHLCVQNNFTFIGWIGDITASHVVPNDKVAEILAEPMISDRLTASDAALQVLGVDDSRETVRQLFSGSLSLPQLWGYAYTLTNGALRLPDTLPTVTARPTLIGTDYRFDVRQTSPATTTRSETVALIVDAMRSLNMYIPLADDEEADILNAAFDLERAEQLT